jgi:hypothetical protein
MPSAEALFERCLLPLYPPGTDLTKARTTDANPGRNPSIVAHLEEAAVIFQARAPELVGMELDFSDASIHRLSVALTPKRRDAWGSELAMVIIHGSAYLGECIRRLHGGEWLVRTPLWESLVGLESRAGRAELAVLHWWLKSLADGAEVSLADRYRTHVEVPCAKPETLPVIAPVSRKLPRIAKVRYDTLHKTLRAHVPELKDLGRDFPTAERFAAYAFRWIDFLWVGEGRMLLMYGLGEGGLHLFWLTVSGFEKSVLVPCENFPEPIVRLEDGKLACIVSRASKVQHHEMLWWGP